MPPCLTLSNIRYVSRVKWSNPGKGVAPSPTPWCNSYWKGSLLVANLYGEYPSNRDALFNRKTDFFSFSSSHCETASKICYKTEIFWFSVITTEWPYRRKHRWKRLSDFKIKFINIYTILREQKYDKTFNWLVLGNNCEIYLVIKEMKKKRKKEIRQIWHVEIFHIIEWFQIGKKWEIWHDVWNLFKFFKKIIFAVKLSEQENSE